MIDIKIFRLFQMTDKTLPVLDLDSVAQHCCPDDIVVKGQLRYFIFGSYTIIK
jgi:hypothetical protein